MNPLKAWLAPAPSEGDRLDADLALVLRFSLWAALGVSGVAMVAALVMQTPNWERLARDASVVLIMTLGLLGLLHRGYVRLTAGGAVLGFGAVAAYAAYTGLGVRGTSYGLFMLVVMVSALFLHWGVAYLVAALASLIGLALVWASRAGLLVNTDRPLAESATWLIQTIYFFIAALILHIALRQKNQALRYARRELAERTRVEEEVRRLNRDLEQRVAERTAQLAASEERYRLISTVSSDYMFSTQLNLEGQMRLNWVAGAFEAMTGYTFDEYVARGGWRMALHPDDVAQDEAALAQLHANQQVVNEVRTLTQSGELRWVRVYAHPVWDTAGQRLNGIYGAVQDITDQKRLEAELQAERDFALQIINTMGQGLTVTDEDSRFVLVNPACAQLIGCEPHELLGQRPADVTVPEDQPLLQQAQRDRRAGKTTRYENQIRRPDGTTTPVLITGSPRWKDGKYAGAIAVITDLTDRKQAEAALTHERNLLQALMDNVPDTIYFKDLASRFTRINHAQARLLGVAAPEDALGKTDLDFQTSETARTFFAEEQELLRTGVPLTDRVEYNPTPQGQPRWLTATKVPVRDAEGRIVGLVGISRDITRRKLAEEREERRRSMMEKVIELGKTITQITDLWQCLRAIHQSVQKGLGFDRVGLFLLEMTSGQIRGAFGTSTTGELEDTRWYTSTVTDHDAWQAALSDPKGFHLIDDYEAVHDLAPDSEMHGVKQHLTLAAWVGEKPVALIATDNVITQRRITEEQLEALQLFAGYAGLALQNARLFAETAEALAREQHLNEVARAISSTLDLPTMLSSLIRLAADLVGAEAGVIGLIAPDGQTLLASYLLHMPEGLGLEHPIPRGQGLAWSVIETGQSTRVADYAAHPLALPHWIAAGVHAYLGVPLMPGGTRLGILGLYNFDPARQFSARDLALAEAVGRQAAVAIQNARWHAELERRVAERTAELEAANRELEGIAYTIAHDLRIPARAMHGYAHILNETYAVQLEAEAQGHLQRIIENARYLGQLVDDLLSFMRLSRAPLHRQRVQMPELVKQALAQVLAKQPNRKIELRLNDLPEDEADPALLGEVWRQLITNALKFSASRAVAQLEIGVGETGAGRYYYIQDNGVGFDMRYVHKLFGVFQRLHHRDEFEGTGMGLAIAQRILQRHGGRIWAKAVIEQGASFYFTLDHPPPAPVADTGEER